jgi:hypothetical protein
MSGKGLRLFILSVLLVALVGFAVAGPKKHGNDKGTAADAQSTQPSGDQKKEKELVETHKAVDPSQYVGAETCKTCHEQQAKGYDQGPHWKTELNKHKGVEFQGCEACHGPGKEHAESADPAKIIRFASLSREESSKRCLTCVHST